jgi:hypothetical protein
VFSGLSRMGIDSPSARTKATWAVVVGVLAPVIQTICFVVLAQGGGSPYG